MQNKKLKKKSTALRDLKLGEFNKISINLLVLILSLLPYEGNAGKTENQNKKKEQSNFTKIKRTLQ